MKLTSFAVLLCLFHSGCVELKPDQGKPSAHAKAVMKANKKAAAEAEQNGNGGPTETSQFF